MCGRYTLTTPGDVLAAALGLESVPELPPRYNIAPSQPVAIVRAGDARRRELALARWGLIPHWAKEATIGARTINARAETVAEKPAFRDSFRRRRCLIPADGFYEWQKREGGKQPYLLRLRDGAPFAFAGLWSRWRDPGSGESLDTCAIVTTTPNELAATVHDRMPVILPATAYEEWLDPEAPGPAALLAPFPAERMTAVAVSRRVNDPTHDAPDCLAPA